MAKGPRSIGLLLALSALAVPGARARELSFAERVQAQAAIERVYYSHQIGATSSFEDAVPRGVLENKVRRYLQQTIALERYWSSPVTAEMLRKEMERQARETRMPERLRELYAALGDDAFLVQECLARAVLVDRLLRNFFAYDARFHAAARAEAEALRQELLRYGIDAFGADSRRREFEIDQAVDAEAFARRRSEAPPRPGEIGSLREEREAFAIVAVLEERPGWARLARFTVRKESWDAWWEATAPGLEAALVRPVADSAALPLLPAGGGAYCFGDEWDNATLDDLPDPRHGATAVWTGSLMVVWGGAIFDFLETGARYDPATDTWTPTSLVGAPDGRRNHTAVWADGLMVVWGGDTGWLGSPLNTGGRYIPEIDAWLPTSTVNAPSARSGHTAVWSGNRMVVWGGTNEAAGNTGGRYDPFTDKWQGVSTTGAPASRGGHSAVWTGSRMIVWGGLMNGSGSYLNSGGRYDPLADSWTPTSTFHAPDARLDHTAIWTGTVMVVWGGGDDPFAPPFNTGGRYDPSTDAWMPTSTVGAAAARRDHTAIWTGERMIVWGGSVDSDTPLNSGGRYDPVTNSWAPTSAAGAPEGRSNHAGVWTGNLMVVWGGEAAYGGLVNSGGRYDAATDTWTPTTTANAPENRASHSAVWTGSSMVVWGGEAIAGHLSTGGRYDLTTSSWTPTSTLGAPSPRAFHTAVWTGDLMIVWGGEDPLWLSTGGRYDPLSDTWTPTSLVGAPAARTLHSAVWTGSRMIVWGGENSVPLGTGGRYDPLTDAWTATSLVDAPAARRGHTAVWTGDRMIVWGGEDTSSVLNSGGRYDPQADSWSATSIAAAPAARRLHSAVWTGDSMIVWGGSNLSTSVIFATGGRYEPDSDAWTPTPSFVEHAGHTAVWTGSAMLVWGGFREGLDGWILSNHGAQYDPLANAWTTIEYVDAPNGRDGHTAVWTGERMIVWGGRLGYNSPVNSGGEYVPAGGPPARDVDGDGFMCEADCNDADAGAHALPGEVTGQAFVDPITLGWDSAAPTAGMFTFYDVIRGHLAELPVGTGASETCLASTIFRETTTDETAPASGTGFWYLVRAKNSCGDGTYGTDSAGAPRTSAACP